MISNYPPGVTGNEPQIVGESDSCVWSEDSDGNWWTECDEGFVFTDGGPKDNKMAFCCYCGRDLEEFTYREEEP